MGALLGLAFAASGAAGLVYQVLWVRELSLVFGVTTFAMSVVVSSFMGGLALGSALAGRWLVPLGRPLVAYALLELAVAAAALLVPAGVGFAGVVHRGVVPPDLPVLADALAQFVLVALVLLVPTTAMGATLPVLSAWVVRETATRGRSLGRLYALNTAGACAGTLFAGLYAIENLGIATTNLLAAGVNTAAAVAALVLSRVAGSPAEPVASEPAVVLPASRDGDGWMPGTAIRVAAAVGLLSLALEVAWTRLLGQVLLTTTYVYSVLLTVVIGGIALGSAFGAGIAARTRRPGVWFGWIELLQGMVVLAALPLLARATTGTAETVDVLVGDAGARMQVLFAIAVLAAGPAALCMGATYPLLATIVTRGDAGVGRAVGRMYSANTVGGIVGAAVAGFLLLPTGGVLPSLVLLAVANLGLGIWAAWPKGGDTSMYRIGFGLLLAAGLGSAVAGSRVHLEDIYAARLPPGSRIRALEEGVVSTVMVADHAEPAVRRIWINSSWVAGTGGSHKMLGHLPMLFGRDPRRVLGVAFGTGQSFGTTLLDGAERLDCVDLNPDVVRLGGAWFADVNHHLLDQPQVHVHIQDARRFVTRPDTTYDVVLMEPLQPWSAGAVNLYTQEYYASLRDVLAPGGLVGQWMPIDDVTPEMTRSVIGTFASVFPDTYVFLDNYDIWLVGAREPLSLDLPGVTARMARPGVREDLDGIAYPDIESVLATCVMGPEALPGYVGGAPLLTDDRPFMEFEAPRTMGGKWFRSNVAAMAAHLAFPAAWSTAAPTLPLGLRDGSAARGLLEGIAAREAGDRVSAHAWLRDAWRSAPEVGRLRAKYRDATADLAAGQAQAGAGAEAEESYRAHLDEDPGFAAGWLNLGVLAAQRGDGPAARDAWDRAAIDPAFVARVDAARALLAAQEQGELGK